MSNFKLNLPTDIPWERICVTEDMIDKVVCDKRLPAKWQTSMAVFKYVPEEEFQLFPKYKITYLKVTATITGYQPINQEIQGQIDWDGVDVSTIPGLTDLLNSYNPCHGAILQVVVGPHGRNPKLQPKDYPFFLDFEPKKRELYELATDTKEKQSRSIESLNITKSSGNTQSLEILDIDMGGGGFGVQASYAGTGGGFSYTAPNGQWGTKRLNADESLSSRSSDVGQEKRETFSFTTQISQMYHLLDSYHMGTNRVVFFIQPRPHVLEEPSGFVRGPRPVDGIQEFFMVVAQPKDQKDFCVSLRLDTSHLTKTAIMDYDRKSKTSGVVSVAIPVPKFSESDVIAQGYQPQPKVDLYQACFVECWDVPYIPWKIEKTATETIDAPADYIIESYTDIRNEASHGSSSVFVAADDSTATITARARGLLYEEAGDAVCIDCPDWVDGYYGSAARQINLNLRSKTKINQVGEEEVLMITTRGLCCCDDKDRVDMEEMVVSIKPLPKELSISRYLDSIKSPSKLSSAQSAKTFAGHEAKSALTHNIQEASGHEEPCKECAEKMKDLLPSSPDPKYTMRLANEISNYIKQEAIKSLSDPVAKPQKFTDTDFFAKRLETTLLQTSKGRKLLNEKVGEKLPKEIVSRLEKHLGKQAKDITRKDMLAFKNENLSKILGLSPEASQKLKLTQLGVKFHEGKKEGGGSGKTESTAS